MRILSTLRVVIAGLVPWVAVANEPQRGDLGSPGVVGEQTTPESITRPPSADELLREIEAQGARAVVSRLFAGAGTRFGPLADAIASGEPEWLRVAARLRPGADAGAALEIDYSVARALPRAPERVLRMIGPMFRVTFICTSPFIEPEPGVAEHYESEALRALRRVHALELHAIRDQCIEGVRRGP